MNPSYEFGIRLRELRQGLGLTQEALAARINYSNTLLSRVERGSVLPSLEFVRRCDQELEAGGALNSLFRDRSRPSVDGPQDDREDRSWLLDLGAGGSLRLMDRRSAISAGIGSLLALSLNSPGRLPTSAVDDALVASRLVLAAMRRLGQTVGPGAVLPALLAYGQSLRQLATQAGARQRADYLTLAARYAEYAGWMAQESGDDRAALWLTDEAVTLANEGGDRDLSDYALVRQALVTLYQGDATRTVQLAVAAQTGRASARVRGLAAQREAQGHALAGDRRACQVALDRARALLAVADAEQDGAVLGSSNLSDPVAMAAGWCEYDLGRPADAAAQLDREMARIPAGALRVRARFGVRRALAYAAAGEAEHACHLTAELMDGIDSVQSATVATDLRALVRELRRSKCKAFQILYPRLLVSQQITR